MTLARKCDICGVLYESYNEESDLENPNTIKFGNTDINDRVDWHEDIDCCPNCMISIVTYIRNLKHK